MAENSCGVAGQRDILSEESWANLAIRVDIRDSFKERSKRTKSARGLLFGIGGNGMSLGGCIFVVVCRNW